MTGRNACLITAFGSTDGTITDTITTGDYVGALFADTSGSDTTLRSAGP